MSAGAAAAAPPLSTTLTTACAWRCGEALYDEYLYHKNVAPDVLTAFSKIDQPSRLKIARSTHKTNPQHIDWLMSCIKRHWEQKPLRERPQPYGGGAAAPSRIERPTSENLAARELQTPPTRATWSTPASGDTDHSPQLPLNTPVVSRAAGEPTVRQLFSPASSGPPPRWVLTAYSAMDNKSLLLAAFMNELDPQSLNSLDAQGPALKIHIAMAALLNPHAWTSVSEHVTRCLATLQRLEDPNSSIASTPSGCFTIKLVVITVGYGCGLGHLATHAALKQLHSRNTHYEL